MKLGFNEANDRFCKNHSVMMDLELCEKYGFDCIDIQSECPNRDLEAGKITLEEMGAWFQPPPQDAFLQCAVLLQHEADAGGKGRRDG